MAAGLSLVAGGERSGPSAEGPTAPIRAAEQVSEQGGAERWHSSVLAPVRGPATLSELFAASPRDGGATGFLLAHLPRDQPLLWVQERMAMLEGGRIYPPGLGLDQLIHVAARDARAALWAMEEGLRCSALGAVVGELWGDPAALDFTATRRLAVAAERGGVAAWLVRLGGSANLSGARMRWRVASAASLTNELNPRAPGVAAWDAELFRARGQPPGRWTVSHDGAADRLHLVAAPGDRAVVQGERRVG